MTNSLRGKTALVTGSTSGIGLGVAQALASAGANIAFNGFGDRALIDVRCSDWSQKYGIRATYAPADVTRVTEVEQMIHHVTNEMGPIDVLVNSAGVNHLDDIEDFPVDKWDLLIAVHLTAAFHTIRLALPSMKARNWGRIINMASVYGLTGSLQRAGYASAKHGLVGLTKVVALETAEFDITCNAICPGLVLTPPVRERIEAAMAAEGKSWDEVVASMMVKRQPSGKLITPEQIGALALFLCSDAGAEIRGAAWNIDGGWTAQ